MGTLLLVTIHVHPGQLWLAPISLLHDNAASGDIAFSLHWLL
jgi:hypothetical protein